MCVPERKHHIVFRFVYPHHSLICTFEKMVAMAARENSNSRVVQIFNLFLENSNSINKKKGATKVSFFVKQIVT